MTREKTHKEIVLAVLSISLIMTALMTFYIWNYYSNIQFQMLGKFSESLIYRYPEQEKNILECLKEQNTDTSISEVHNILTEYGYQKTDFGGSPTAIILFAVICFLLAGMVLFIVLRLWNRKIEIRIHQLTNYLEKINTGGQGLLMDCSDDAFSGLQDEIYKTIITLFQTREAALKSKENYADNLSNIAHQLKTPITAISLSVQMSKRDPTFCYAEQIQKQLNRLIHLEESLLLLSRIDAGTLDIKRRETDVFTLLTLAADNLQELFAQADVQIEIPESEAVDVFVDMDWTMEAILNIIKNCMEHSKAGGMVRCSYEKNPLYVQIQIWDEGNGFDKEDLYHIFERFYRGKNATDNGIGIGLPLAKAIIEMQNGMISACNKQTGGACFELRFYSH